MRYASMVVEQAKYWLGCNEKDGSHKKIIDTYNGHTPLARGYKVKYTDEWCATFVSAVSIKLGYTNIMPTECSCYYMVELYKKLGAWVEDESVTPKPGWILFYDWQDNGVGDNKGTPDHVGIVEKVVGDTIHVIEGNRSNSVRRIYIRLNAKQIRGYAAPKYAHEEEEKKGEIELKVSVLKKGAKGSQVEALQALLIGYGYSCGPKGVDGDFGSATDKALRAYQGDHGLEVDGSCGPATWNSLLGLG